MANTFQNPVMYTNETLACMQNAIVLGKKVSRKHQMEFGKEEMKIGDTLNIRRPARFTVSSGAAYQPQAYTETSIPLVINYQKHVDTTMTSADLTLKDQDFSDRVIRPGAIQIAQQIDIDGYVNAKNTIGNLVGTPGTSPNNVSFLTDVGKKLDDISAPRDGNRYMALSQGTNASMIPALAGFFNAQGQIAKQYTDGVFVDGTNTVGLKIAMSQNVAKQTVGALGGTPLVNGSGQGLADGWANTGSLITNGWSSAASNRLKAGDVYTVGSVYAVNPVTKQSTGDLLQFCVVQDQSSDASGNLTIVSSPALIYGGPFQNASVSATTSAAITVSGTASTAYTRNLAWHEDAFELAVVKLIDLAQFGGWGASRSQNGFSMRVFRQAAISSDSVGTRTDVLYGWCSSYPEWACQEVAA